MFAENLKAVRTKSGLSQKVVADKIFISQQAYAKYEQGKSSPDPETIIKLCRIFDCTLDDLFDTAKSGAVNIDTSTMINSVRDSKNTTLTVTGNYDLSPQERGLIDMFRSLSFEDQVSIMQAVVEAAKRHN